MEKSCPLLNGGRKKGVPKGGRAYPKAFELVSLDGNLVLGHKSLSIVYEFQGDGSLPVHTLATKAAGASHTALYAIRAEFCFCPVPPHEERPRSCARDSAQSRIFTA